MCWLSLSNGATTGNEAHASTNRPSIIAALRERQRATFRTRRDNGQSLIGNITGSSGTFASISWHCRNEVGSTLRRRHIQRLRRACLLTFTTTQLGGATAVAALITASGTFINKSTPCQLGDETTYGSATNYVNNQVSYNNDKINALNTGLAHWWTPILRSGILHCCASTADQAAARHAVADPGQPRRRRFLLSLVRRRRSRYAGAVAGRSRPRRVM